MLPAVVGVWGRRGACPLVVPAPPPPERSTRPTPLYSGTRSGRPDKGQQSNLRVCRHTEINTLSFQKLLNCTTIQVSSLYKHVPDNYYNSKQTFEIGSVEFKLALSMKMFQPQYSTLQIQQYTSRYNSQLQLSQF